MRPKRDEHEQALVERLWQVVDDLRARVEQLEAAQSRLSRRDRLALSRLLPAIGGACGSTIFAVREVIALPAVRVVIGSLSAHAIGRLLKRSAGHAVAGYVVERMGSEDHRALWRVMRAIDAPHSPGVATPTTTLSVGSSTCSH